MKYIGNSTSAIDWNALLEQLSHVAGRGRGSDQPDDIHHNPKVQALQKQWEEAGYKDDQAVGWLDYDVPQDIADKFADFLGVTAIGAWITCVPPGYVVPWHYDINDNEEAMLAKGEVLRYTCHISKPKFGQVLVLEDHAFHMEEQGNVYQWDNWQDWHGGMNMGLEPKFLFNFMGYAK